MQFKQYWGREMQQVEILVTGGLGYIGSHTCVQLIKAGLSPVIIDNLCNAKLEVLNRIERLTGMRPVFYQCDVRNEQQLAHIFFFSSISFSYSFCRAKSGW